VARRRAAGIALIALGTLLLGSAGAVHGRALLREEGLRRAWDAAEARRAVRTARAALGSGERAAPPTIGEPVARLRIPRLGLDEIVVAGVGDDELLAAPGHLPGSALPGDSGNAVLSAHRDRHFSSLGALRIGDTITTETAHKSVVWVVRQRRVVHRAAPALRRSVAPTLTLTTCWPVRWFGPAPERLILTAEPVR